MHGNAVMAGHYMVMRRAPPQPIRDGWFHRGARLDTAPDCKWDGARHLCRFIVRKPTGHSLGACRSDTEAA